MQQQNIITVLNDLLLQVQYVTYVVRSTSSCKVLLLLCALNAFQILRMLCCWG